MNMKALTGKKQILAAFVALAVVIGAVGVIGASSFSDAADDEFSIAGDMKPESSIEAGAGQKVIIIGDLVVKKDAKLILNEGSELVVNEEFTVTLEDGATFTINKGGKATVNGTINVDGKQSVTMMGGSEMTVNGALNINAENALDVKDGANLMVPGYLNVKVDGSATFTGNVNVSGNAAFNGIATGKVNLAAGAVVAVDSAKTALSLVLDIVDSATVNVINVAGSVDVTDKAGNKVNVSNIKAVTITHVNNIIVAGNPVVSNVAESATIGVTSGVVQIGDMTTDEVRILITDGAKLLVTGALKAEKDNGVPMIHGKGDLTVFGYDSVITTDEDQPLVINTKTNPDAGLDFNGVTYIKDGLNYYVTIERAISNLEEGTITVYGDVVISEDLTIPDNVTIDLTEADSLTVTKDATVTIEKDIDGDGTGGNIKTTDTPVNVEGTIIVEDITVSDEMTDSAVNADVTLKNGNEVTYTNLQNALDTVSPNETISLRKDVALKDDLLIPEFVTLDLDGHKLYVDDANAAGETVTITVQGLLDVTDANSVVDLATKGQLVIDDNNLENDYYPFVKFVGSNPIDMNKVKAAQFIMDEDGTGANNLFVLTSVLGTQANMEKIADNVTVTVTYDFVDYTKDLNFTSAKKIGFSFKEEFTTDGNIDFGNNSAVFYDNVEADEIITSSSVFIMNGVDATLVGNVTTDLKGYVNLVNAKGCADNSMLMLYIDNGKVVFEGNIVQDVAGIDSSATFGGALTIIGQHVGDADVGVDFIIADGADLVVKPVQSVINGTPLNLYEIFSDLTVPAGASIDFDVNGKPVAVIIGGNVVVNGDFGKQNGRLAVAIACEDKHTHGLTIAENATAYVKALAVAGDINVAGTLDVVELFTNTNLTVTGTGKILMTGDSPTIAVLKDMIEMFIGADIGTQLKTYLDSIDPALFPMVQDIYNAYQNENTPGAIIARNIDNSGTIETNVLVANGNIVNTKDVEAEIIGATGDITLGGNVPTFAIASMGNITIPEGANVEAAYVLALKAVDIDGTLVTPEMITIQELRNIIYTYLQTEIEGYLNSIDPAIRDEIYALYNAVNGYDVPSVILGASVDISGNAKADVIAACLLPEHVENGIEGGYVNISGTVDSSFIASAIVTFDEEKNEYVFNGGAVDISGTVTTDFVGGKDVNISGTVNSVYVIAENAIDVTGTVTARDALVNQPNTKLEGSVIAKTLNVTKMIDSTIVDIENKVTVGADGEIITDLFLAHDLDLAGKLTVNGYDDPSIIYGIANIDGENGMMSVAGEMKIGTAKVINGGAIVTDATADVCVEKLYVGIAHEDIFETGKRDISAGTIGDMVILDTNGAAYVSANSNVGAGIKQFASTKFYNVNTNYQGKLWFTAYQNGSPAAINDVKAGEDLYAYIDGWRYTATFPGQIVDNEVIGYPDAVYQNIRYDIYSITVVADPAIGGVYIENMPLSKSGNVFYMDSNMSYDSNKTSYAVSGNLTNGYKGTFADNVTMYVNGEIRENFDFVLPANGDNLQQIDIKITLGYDATGVPSDTGGLTLIETLLIIITAAIIVIGVVVIFRMLRS